MFSLLAKQLGVEFFKENLADLCVKWLEDKIFAIREAALECLKDFAEIFGKEWFEKQALPSILVLHENPVFANRITPLLSVSVLLDKIDDT